MSRLPYAAPIVDAGVPSQMAASAANRLFAHVPGLVPLMGQLARGLTVDIRRTPRPLQELIVLRVAQLTGDAYLWTVHRARTPEIGISEEKIKALAAWRASNVFDEVERAALRCADGMRQAAVDDDSFAALQRVFSRTQFVELIAWTGFAIGLATMHQALGLEVPSEYEQYLEGFTSARGSRQV